MSEKIPSNIPVSAKDIKKKGRKPGQTRGDYILVARSAIPTMRLVQALAEIALDKNELGEYKHATSHRLEAIRISLNKVLPDVKAVEIQVNNERRELTYEQKAIAARALAMVDGNPALPLNSTISIGYDTAPATVDAVILSAATDEPLPSCSNDDPLSFIDEPGEAPLVD